MSSEIRLYEALGIRQFQKLVFRLERFRHRGDGDRNVNYHFVSRGADAPERFIRYLFLNAGIHISGLAATLVFIGIFAVMPGTLPTAWAAGIIGVIGNIYCIMLQRYNYLRVMRALQKQEKRLEKQTAQWKERAYGRLRQAESPAMLREAAQCLQRMRADLERQGYTIISGSDEKAISWLAAIFGARTAKVHGNGKKGVSRVMWRPELVPYTAKDRKARRVMRFLGKQVSDPQECVFFADSSEGLRALRELFDTAPAVETTELLEIAENVLSGQETVLRAEAAGGEEVFTERHDGAAMVSVTGIRELGYDRKGLPFNIFQEMVLSVLQPGKKRKLEPDPEAQALLREAFAEGQMTLKGLYDLRSEENRELCDQLLLRLFMYCGCDFAEDLRDPELKTHLEVLTGEYLRECRAIISARELDHPAGGKESAKNAAAGKVPAKNTAATIMPAKRTAAENVPPAVREEDNRRMAVLNCMYLSRKARACGLRPDVYVLVR